MTTRARKKTLSRQQYERRTDGRIVRVEVSLNTKSTGDIYISDHLNELPPEVTKSDYLRAALLDKIATERRETDTDKEIAALRAEVAASRAEVAASRDQIAELKALIVELAAREVKVQLVQAAQVTVGPAQPTTLPEMPPLPGEQAASGIDMGRPRPRAQLKRGPVAEDAAHDVTDEFDAVALAREMARSVGNFGKGKQ